MWPCNCLKWPCWTIAKLYMSMLLIEMSVNPCLYSVHVFLHSNPLFVSLIESYGMCKLNFLMRYVNCHLISKYALEIMSEQTRRGWKNVQIASIWARKSHLEGLWRCLRDRKSKLPRPKWSQEWFAPVPISDFWIKNGTKIYKKMDAKKGREKVSQIIQKCSKIESKSYSKSELEIRCVRHAMIVDFWRMSLTKY